MMTTLKTVATYFLFFSLPLVATFKGKGIIISLLLAFFLFNGFSSFVKFFTKKEWQGICGSALGIGLLLILYCVGLTLFTGPFSSLFHFGRLLVLVGISFFTIRGAQQLSLSDRRKMVHIFFIAYVFYALFLLLEVHGGHWISRLYWEEKSFNHNQFLRGIVILTFLFLPFSYALKMYSSKRTFILFLGFSVVILLLILLKAQPSAARVAVLFAGLFFVMGHCYKKWRTFILISVGAYLVVAPFLFLHTLNRQTLFDLMHYLPSSYQHRIEIWNETSKHIRENLLIGHGFDHSSQFKEAPPRCVHHRTAEFDAIRTDETIISKTPYAWGGVVCYKDSLLTTHPHSGSLQIWLEFGLVGIGIVCFLLYKFIQYADAQIPLYRSYLYSLLGMGLVYWNVSFGLWQSWMIALVTLTFSLFQLIKSLPSNKKEDAHV